MFGLVTNAASKSDSPLRGLAWALWAEAHGSLKLRRLLRSTALRSAAWILRVSL